MIKKTFAEISYNFKKLSEGSLKEIEDASEMMIKSLSSNGKILFCGNGGSAADAQHLSAELIGRYRKNRRPLAAVALTTDTSSLTAIGNDFSFNDIFARQVEAIGNEKDILYAISTSGNSENVINAIKSAKKKSMFVIGVTGLEGGKMNDFCDILITVPADRPDRIQEMHIAVGQVLCEIIENTLC
jgi:D-sedoheptulose 7-phosphate isomerase